MFYLLYLVIISCFHSFADQVQPEKNGPEFLLCRKCGADVGDSSYLFSKLSPGTQKVEKQRLFGVQNVTVQTLINPFGINFDVITAEKARCNNIGPSQGADSWFPGYTWRICACPHCGHHLGWTFESLDTANIDKKEDHIQAFHGLILGNILGENFTDSLIMMPKMHM